MTHKENITAILECYFSGFKKEIIDSACNRILEQSNSEYYEDYTVLSALKAYRDGKKDALNKIRAEIEKNASRYTISRERDAMGQVEWSDRLIKESEVLKIIDKYLLEVSE